MYNICAIEFEQVGVCTHLLLYVQNDGISVNCAFVCVCDNVCACVCVCA